MILLADPSVCSSNTGDQIISRAVHRELTALFAKHGMVVVPTQTGIGYRGRRLLRQSAVALIGGTNLLNASAGPRQTWRLPPLPPSMRKFVGVGIGWGSGDREPTWAGRRYLASVLHPSATHSVRDRFTEDMLRHMGFNALYTGCPTMWRSDTGHLSRTFAGGSSQHAVLVLNRILRAHAADRSLIAGVTERYSRVSFWRQSTEDDDYLNELPPSVEVLPRSLDAFETCLAATPDTEVVTSRLHAALFAQRLDVRTTLFAADQRTRRCAGDAGMTWFPLPDGAGDVRVALSEGERSPARPDPGANAQWLGRLETLIG